MDIDFKEPKLELHYLIHAAVVAGHKEELRTYLLSKCNAFIYKTLVERGVLEYSKEDFATMAEVRSETLEKLEIEKVSDEENECHIFEVNKRICEFYAQSMNLDNFVASANGLLSVDSPISLRMDMYMCKIRIAIVMDDRISLVENVNKALSIYEGACDWDRKNRFKIYLGLYSLIKAEFREAAILFSEGLASFDATELLSNDKLILYLVFSSLLGFNRTEIKEKILENSDVRKYSECISLAENYYNCDYGKYFYFVLQFIDVFADDAFIGSFKDHFCKEMKIAGYKQLLLSYQSLHLDRMADVFGIQPEHLESDLRSFISEERIQCRIDRVVGVVKMVPMQKADHILNFFDEGAVVLRSIKKQIN